MTRALLLALLAAAAPARGDDLPSPDAMWLGQRLVPQDLVDGYRNALLGDVLDRVAGGRIPAVRRPVLQARARAAVAPLLDEAFPAELLAGVGAQFLARHYSADELRALRSREESPLGRRLRDLERQAAAAPATSPAEREQAHVALLERSLGASDRRELESFERSPLGRKGAALAPDLVAHYLDELDRRWAAVRGELDPRLRSTVEAVLQAEPAER